MQNVHVVQECFHRFCGDCIRKHHLVKHDCPSCFQHIPTRRSLKPDIEFDNLIQTLTLQYKLCEEIDKINVSKYRSQHQLRIRSMKQTQNEKRKVGDGYTPSNSDQPNEKSMKPDIEPVAPSPNAVYHAHNSKMVACAVKPLNDKDPKSPNVYYFLFYI